MSSSMQAFVDAVLDMESEAIEAAEKDWLTTVIFQVIALKETKAEDIEAKIRDIEKRYGEDFRRLVSHVEAFISVKGNAHRVAKRGPATS